MTRRSCPGPSVRCVSCCCRVLVILDEVSREIAGYLPAVGSQRLEFKPAPDALSSVLTYCDMTTSPDGETASPCRPESGSPRSTTAAAPGTW
jgi:hypothetical protein